MSEPTKPDDVAAAVPSEGVDEFEPEWRMSRRDRLIEWLTISSFLGLGVLVIALLVFLVIALVPGDLPEQTDPSFIDLIVRNKGVIAAARVTLILVASYLVASVIAHIYKQRWIFQAGPFRVHETTGNVEDYVAAAHELQDALTEQLEINAQLEQRVVEADRVLESLLVEYEAQQEELERLRASEEH